MKYLFPLFILLILGCEKEEKPNIQPLQIKSQEQPLHVKIKNIENKLKNIDTVPYLEDYIVDIILNGSSQQLGFPAGNMQGGFAYKSDAKDIARYVVTLSNQKSTNDKKAEKAALFFTSNCGGCHGHNGKGLNGAFPNLTLNPLKGIIKKKKYLESSLNLLKKEL